MGIAGLTTPLDFAVGALKNGKQLLVLLQRAAVYVGAAAGFGGGGFGVGRGGCVQPAGKSAVQMGLGGDLVPFDKIPGAVGAKYRVGGVFGVGVGVGVDGSVSVVYFALM